MLPGFNKKVKYYDGEVPAREALGGLYIKQGGRFQEVTL